MTDPVRDEEGRSDTASGGEIKGGTVPFVPAAARADTFTLDVGFISSKAEAERLVNAFK